MRRGDRDTDRALQRVDCYFKSTLSQNTGKWKGEFFRWNGGISRLPSVSGKTPSKVVAARQINYADAAFAALGFKDRCVNMLQNHTCDVGVGVRLKRAFAFGLA